MDPPPFFDVPLTNPHKSTACFTSACLQSLEEMLHGLRTGSSTQTALPAVHADAAHAPAPATDTLTTQQGVLHATRPNATSQAAPQSTQMSAQIGGSPDAHVSQQAQQGVQQGVQSGGSMQAAPQSTQVGGSPDARMSQQAQQGVQQGVRSSGSMQAAQATQVGGSPDACVRQAQSAAGANVNVLAEQQARLSGLALQV